MQSIRSGHSDLIRFPLGTGNRIAQTPVSLLGTGNQIKSADPVQSGPGGPFCTPLLLQESTSGSWSTWTRCYFARRSLGINYEFLDTHIIRVQRIRWHNFGSGKICKCRRNRGKIRRRFSQWSVRRNASWWLRNKNIGHDNLDTLTIVVNLS